MKKKILTLSCLILLSSSFSSPICAEPEGGTLSITAVPSTQAENTIEIVLKGNSMYSQIWYQNHSNVGRMGELLKAIEQEGLKIDYRGYRGNDLNEYFLAVRSEWVTHLQLLNEDDERIPNFWKSWSTLEQEWQKLSQLHFFDKNLEKKLPALEITDANGAALDEDRLALLRGVFAQCFALAFREPGLKIPSYYEPIIQEGCRAPLLEQLQDVSIKVMNKSYWDLAMEGTLHPRRHQKLDLFLQSLCPLDDGVIGGTNPQLLLSLQEANWVARDLGEQPYSKAGAQCRETLLKKVMIGLKTRFQESFSSTIESLNITGKSFVDHLVEVGIDRPLLPLETMIRLAKRKFLPKVLDEASMNEAFNPRDVNRIALEMSIEKDVSEGVRPNLAKALKAYLLVARNSPSTTNPNSTVVVPSQFAKALEKLSTEKQQLVLKKFTSLYTRKCPRDNVGPIITEGKGKCIKDSTVGIYSFQIKLQSDSTLWFDIAALL
ncbi:MAG: hypothetical protein HQK52_09185 [Oligoflexia bacterium]|nr:hypothetical protein [Oligoflexia bacterium]